MQTIFDAESFKSALNDGKSSTVVRYRRNMALLCAAVVAIASPLRADAETYTGRVTHISDGDTLTVLDAKDSQHRIRLASIDAPEKRQSYGAVSRQALAALVFERYVTVETHKRDRYQREVGRVLVQNIDVALEQLKSGLAWHYKKYAGGQPENERAVYAQAEETARTRRIGLWSDPQPVAPWDFRHQRTR